MSTPLGNTTTLATLVTRTPELMPILDRLHLDYCCGGSQTLGVAANERGLDLETLIVTVRAIEESAPVREESRGSELGEMGIPELCDRIVSRFHDRLRSDLPELDEIVAKVVEVHSAERPGLAELGAAFGSLRDEIETHIAEEETELFPQLRALEAGESVGLDVQLVDEHIKDHSRVGEGLANLRRLTNDYDRSEALCQTHRQLYDRLEQFESEMHHHVHEENNVLFPWAKSFVRAASYPA